MDSDDFLSKKAIKGTQECVENQETIRASLPAAKRRVRLSAAKRREAKSKPALHRTRLCARGISVRAIEFINQDCGWVTGQFGRIHHTTNGGETWILQADIPNAFIYSLDFVDSLNGWGAAGELIRTSNGGATWWRDSTILWALDVRFITPSIGWAAGQYMIARTSDAGRTWNTLHTSFYRWTKLFVLDAQHAWAVSETGQIIATSNGGTTWSYQTNPSAKRLRGVSFRDSLKGIAVGALGTILQTSNGGTTWQNVTRAVTSQPLYGVHFLTPKLGWIAGWGGTILRTTNSGTTWDSLTTGSNARLFDLEFVNPQNGWAVGNAGAILRTTSGGNTWTNQTSPVIRHWRDIEFTNYPVGWIVGGDALSDGRLLKTTDGGNSWIEVNSISLPPGASQIQFTSPNVGWIMAGSTVTGSGQQMYKTTNGGESWNVVLTNNSDTTFFSMSFVSNDVGWLSTFQLLLFHTDNGGMSWQTLPTPDYFESISFVDSLKGWALAITGEIYKTTNGGKVWTPQSNPIASANKVKFFGMNDGWVIGASGGITHTSNGGMTFLESQKEHGLKSNRTDLLKNFPNPFNGQTVIRFVADQTTRKLQLEIYDVLGRRIFQTIIQHVSAGPNEFVWHGTNEFGQELSSGLYFGIVRSNTSSFLTKMLLIR